MKNNFINIEIERQSLQLNLDAAKTSEERNKLGQFSTPFPLAEDILRYARSIWPDNTPVNFLDPAIGTGSFFSALNAIFDSSEISSALGYEIDSHYAIPSAELWKNSKLKYFHGDFTQQEPLNNENKCNLIICNPPYVRHHHLKGVKEQLQKSTLDSSNMKLSGLAGLYCYFMGLTHPWLADGAISAWLIPSEFMDVNYGKAVKAYLLNEVSLLHIHRFDPKDVQFDDALVSSAVVWFRKSKSQPEDAVLFTYGGSLNEPRVSKFIDRNELLKEHKWSRFPVQDIRTNTEQPKLKDFFDIKRGIATGDNDYFVLTKQKIQELGLPIEHFRAILPSPRYLKSTTVEADNLGFPDIEEQLFVLDCRLEMAEIESLYPKLFAYLQHGIESGVSERYLCKNRKIWYAQETRKHSLFYCTYIGRSDSKDKKPFRFIHNKTTAIVSNSYLILYPKIHLLSLIENHPEISEQILNSITEITGQALLDEGRVYGGGMHKLEPKELSNVPAEALQQLLNIYN